MITEKMRGEEREILKAKYRGKIKKRKEHHFKEREK